MRDADAQADTPDTDGAAGTAVTHEHALSVVDGLRRARRDDDTLEDAVRLANLRAQLLDRRDSPVRVGRFHLLAPVGRGGMGTVYEAYDPELDRKVALKLVRATDRAVERSVLDEGKALAKLGHPNVVAVYEIGEHEGETFVVMELVRGPNLRAWMHAPGGGPRPWPEVVRVFCAAAAGLAAAHAAGVRHGDVKPDNIVVADDGRTRVVDFGISALLEADGAPTLAGTPSYMAPEQLGGAEVDARADQYGFCVALFEVLHLARPTATPVFASSIPRWLQRIVARGLARDPADRFASFDDIAAALERGRHGRSRRIAAVLGLGACASIGWLALRDDAVDPCVDARAQVTLGDRVDEPRLAAHVARLDALASSICAWEHAPPDSRPALLAERRACLDAAVAVTDAAIASIDRGAAPLVGAMPYVLDQLELTAVCDDPAILRLSAAVTTEPGLRERIAAVDWDLLAATGEAAAGFTQEATERLAAIDLDDPPLAAARAGRVRLGQLRIAMQDAGKIPTDDLREVLWTALANDHMLDAIEAASLLTIVVAERDGVEASAPWFELASALLRRGGDPSRPWAVLWRARARGLAANTRFAEAEAAIASAAAHTSAEDPVATIALLHDRASLRGVERRWSEAEADYAAALALHRERHGSEHPAALDLELERALAVAGDGRSEDALALLDDIVARLAEHGGELHGRTLRARRARCIILGSHRGPAEEEPCQRALADSYRAAGRAHQAAGLELDRATTLASLGRDDEAAAILRRALQDDDAVWAPLRITAALARVDFHAGRVDDALALLGDRLRNDDERSEVADRARQTEVDLLLAAGRVDEAERALSRAMQLATGDPIGFVGRRGMLHAARGDLRAALPDLETGMLMAAVEVDVMGPFARTLAEVRAALDPADPRAREMAELALELYDYAPGTANEAAAVRRFVATLP